jgi:hypothetical protein
MSPGHIPKALRDRVANDARHRCGYCLTVETVVGTPMDIDHILPQARGGTNDEANLWLACALCNSHKGDKLTAIDPLSGESVRLFDPRRQAWVDHFAWSSDAVRIVGLTPTGRATVSALNLNRPSLVIARELWVAAGWHPPRD